MPSWLESLSVRLDIRYVLGRASSQSVEQQHRGQVRRSRKACIVICVDLLSGFCLTEGSKRRGFDLVVNGVFVYQEFVLFLPAKHSQELVH